MDFSRNEAFSAHRLGGEPVPEDVQKFLRMRTNWRGRLRSR